MKNKILCYYFYKYRMSCRNYWRELFNRRLDFKLSHFIQQGFITDF